MSGASQILSFAVSGWCRYGHRTRRTRIQRFIQPAVKNSLPTSQGFWLAAPDPECRGRAASMRTMGVFALLGMSFKPTAHHCLKESIFWRSIPKARFNGSSDSSAHWQGQRINKRLGYCRVGFLSPHPDPNPTQAEAPAASPLRRFPPTTCPLPEGTRWWGRIRCHRPWPSVRRGGGCGRVPAFVP